jgi:hypothetical protein
LRQKRKKKRKRRLKTKSRLALKFGDFNEAFAKTQREAHVTPNIFLLKI